MTNLPKYVVQYEATGKVYTRLIRGKGPGCYRKTLREPVGTPAFYVEYATALAESERHVRPVHSYVHTTRRPGRTSQGRVMQDLIANYRRSDEYRNLRATTQQTYRNLLAVFEQDHGHRPVEQTDAKFYRDLFKTMKPAVAFNLRKRLAAVYRAAEDAEWIEGNANPLIGVRAPKYRAKGWTAWSEDDVTAFLQHHKPGTVAHLALALALETASRRGDLVRLGTAMLTRDPASGVMGYSFNQSKTGSEVFIPLTTGLYVALDHADAAGTLGRKTYLQTQHGEPFTVAGFGNFMRAAAKAAGVKAPLHGLRKLAITRLLDRGVAPQMAMAISGHTSFQEFQKYVGTRDRRALAIAGASNSSNNMNSKPLNSEFKEQVVVDRSPAGLHFTAAEKAKFRRAMAFPTGFEPVF
jgi:integrase